MNYDDLWIWVAIVQSNCICQPGNSFSIYPTKAPSFSTLSLPRKNSPTEMVLHHTPHKVYPEKQHRTNEPSRLLLHILSPYPKNNIKQINHPDCFSMFSLTHSNLTIRIACHSSPQPHARHESVDDLFFTQL
jgi:hypothetical protein